MVGPLRGRADAVQPARTVPRRRCTPTFSRSRTSPVPGNGIAATRIRRSDNHGRKARHVRGASRSEPLAPGERTRSAAIARRTSSSESSRAAVAAAPPVRAARSPREPQTRDGPLRDRADRDRTRSSAAPRRPDGWTATTMRSRTGAPFDHVDLAHLTGRRRNRWRGHARTDAKLGRVPARPGAGRASGPAADWPCSSTGEATDNSARRAVRAAAIPS